MNKGWVLSQKAEEDILNIFLFTAEEFGIVQAERYHTLLEESFQFLAQNPEAARARDELIPPVRVHPVQAHIVLYDIAESGSIFIIRVRHAHEDWDQK